MPRMDVDCMAKKLFEDITVVMGGVTYTVGKVTADSLKIEDSDGDPLAGGRQLAKLFGVAPKTFDKEDIRAVGIVLKFVMDEIVKQMGESVKNSPAAEDTPLG